MPDNQSLLEEIRENYDDALREWEDVRSDGRADMRMIADGPWPEAEKNARMDPENPRPCESFDELGQYLNQAIGDMRQNKRAVKVTPEGNGANDQTALKRAGMIRQIEYDSNAQTAYATAFENMVKRSYGFAKLGSRCADPEGGFDQVLYIGTVANPDSVIVDPYAKQPDWSDMEFAFEVESFSSKQFKRKWPRAEKISFDAHDMEVAAAWVSDTRVQVASYWRRDVEKRNLLLIDGGAEGLKAVHEDELPAGSKVDGNQVALPHPSGKHVAFPLRNMRKTERPAVTQYITNGIEILEKNPTKWLEIPIIPLFGPEEWVDDGTGSRRRLLSMVRKARGPYMGYCYARTTEIEVVGMSPKILYLGYEGQFNTKTPWDRINKTNMPYGEVKGITTATGAAILPKPERVPYDPPIQSLEMAAASFKAAIQSAMGVGGMMNGNRRQNLDARSGKALEELDKQENQGTYIYVSNYERFIARIGRMLEQGLTWCYDTPRDAGMRGPDDKHSVEKINQVDAAGRKVGFHTSIGDHSTTISVGPSDDSTRDAANDFADTLMAIPNIAQTHPQAVGKAIRLRNLGPIGDQLADIFDPQGGPAPLPPAVQQHMAQSNEMVTKLTQRVNELTMAAMAKVPELQSKERMHAQDLDFQREKLAVEASIGAAKIGSAEAIERLNVETAIIAQERGQAAEQLHEKVMQAADQAHEAGMQQAGAQNDAGAQASDQQHQAGMQSDAQQHQAGMQADAQEHATDLQKSAQDADATGDSGESGD
jgi:hypothetical protein